MWANVWNEDYTLRPHKVQEAGSQEKEKDACVVLVPNEAGAILGKTGGRESSRLFMRLPG